MSRLQEADGYEDSAKGEEQRHEGTYPNATCPYFRS